MQFTPPHIDVAAIEKMVEEHPELHNIHHIHLWQLNDHEVFFEGHLDFRENLSLEEVMNISMEIENSIKEAFDITHVTLQSEYLKEDDKALVYGT